MRLPWSWNPIPLLAASACLWTAAACGDAGEQPKQHTARETGRFVTPYVPAPEQADPVSVAPRPSVAVVEPPPSREYVPPPPPVDEATPAPGAKIWMPDAEPGGEPFVILPEETPTPAPQRPEEPLLTVPPPSHMRLFGASAVRQPQVADYLPVRFKLNMRCPRACYVQVFAKAWDSEHWQSAPMDAAEGDWFTKTVRLPEAAARGPIQWYINAIDDRARSDGLYSRQLPNLLELREEPPAHEQTFTIPSGEEAPAD